VSSQSIDEMIESYFMATTTAVGVLFREQLLGHTLIVVYATIDACGLLDAPAGQDEATGASFKAWVKNYLLCYPGLECNEVDLWAARCATLHTFRSSSKLSGTGAARELQCYTGDKSAPHIQQFIAFTKAHDGGKHLPVHYGDLLEAFFQGIKAFVPDLSAACAASQVHAERMRKLVQTHHHEPAS